MLCSMTGVNPMERYHDILFPVNEQWMQEMRALFTKQVNMRDQFHQMLHKEGYDQCQLGQMDRHGKIPPSSTTIHAKCIPKSVPDRDTMVRMQEELVKMRSQYRSRLREFVSAASPAARAKTCFEFAKDNRPSTTGSPAPAVK